MKLARQLERRLEDALDSLAGRIFRGGLHASELAARVAREAELAEFTTPAGPATANQFHLLINPANLEGSPEPIEEHIAAAFTQHSADRGWLLRGPAKVLVSIDSSVPIGTVRCEAAVVPGPLPVWAHLVAADGSSLEVRQNRSLLGRSPDVDLVIDRPQISRVHALVYRQDGEAYVRDLRSANGTTVDGIRVGRIAVVLPAAAKLGLAEIPFRFSPCQN